MAPLGQSLLTIFRQQRVVPAVLLAVVLLAAVNWMLACGSGSKSEIGRSTWTSSAEFSV